MLNRRDGRRAVALYFSTATCRHSGGSADMGIGGFGLPSILGCSASSVNHQFSDLSQPSPGGDRVLRLALVLALRATDADVEMVVMPPIGAHLVHPRFARVFFTQRLLDRGVDEDALDLGFFRRGFDDRRLGARTNGRDRR